jgi:hypothetical protein
MMLKYMKEQWIFVYINYLYRIFNISFLFCRFILPAYSSPTYIKKWRIVLHGWGRAPKSVNGDCDTSTKHNVLDD